MVALWKIGSLLEEAKRHAQQYERLQSIYQQRDYLDQLTGIQSAQIRQEAQFRTNQLAFQNQSLGVKTDILDTQIEASRRASEEQLQQDAEIFGANIGVMRARAANNNIDLRGSFLDAQSELTSRFERGQAVKRQNVEAQIATLESQKKIVELEQKSTVEQLKQVSKREALQVSELQVQSASKALNLDTQARMIEIDRIYTLATGEDKILGRLLTDIGIGGKVPFVF